jgi:murein DD-endopeptidase MepM/ murein hydrolase activator NlpD
MLRLAPSPPAPTGRALVTVVALALGLALGACSGDGQAGGATAASSVAAATGSSGDAATDSSGAAASSTTVRRPARYVFPVQPVASCNLHYGHFHHDYPATDIFSKKGCRFVAPTDGVVTEVSRTDRWDPATNRGADRGGRSVAMLGDDGVRYYGSHLERVDAAVGPGTRVRAGQLLGLIDNSGDARGTATHLHFGISWPTRDGVWWVRRGTVYPWPYLDSWRAGGNRSPARAVRAALAEAGQRVPACTRGC